MTHLKQEPPTPCRYRLNPDKLAPLFFTELVRKGMALLPLAILTSLLVGVVELLLLPKNGELEFFRCLDFFFLAASLSALVTIPIWVVFSVSRALVTVLSRRTNQPRTIAAFAFGLTALPYALWLCRFTFSGPTVVGLWYRPILVILATLGLAVAFGLSLLLFLYQPSRSLPRVFLGGTLLAFGGAALLLNQRVIPGQYEPLHTLLSLITCLCFLLSLTQLVPWIGRKAPRLPKVGRVALLVIFLGAPPTAILRLPLAPKVGALVTQSSVTPRYLIVAREESNEAISIQVAALLKQVKPSVVAPRALEARRARGQKRPNIVLFFVDNMSPSRTGFLGYHKNPTTPNMDRLASNGAVFTQAYSVLPHTRLFTTSLLLGHYSHLAAPDHALPQLVQNSVTNLLHRHNYHVMIQNWFELSRGTGFKPARFGVDTYVRPPTPEEEAATDNWPAYSVPGLLARISDHLDEARRTESPVFLWVHMVNPHGIPRGPGMYRHDPQFSFGSTLDDRYDGAIASADQWFSPLKKLLDEKLTDPQNTYYVFGSDHGSGITRFRKKVSKTTWQDHVHVPLAIAGPGIEKRRNDYTVDSALDLSATVLDMAGIDPPNDYDGITLLPLVTGEWKPNHSRPVVVSCPPQWQGVILGNKKLVKNKGTLSLFDLDQDPDEQKDIADKEPALTRRLGQLATQVIQRRAKARTGSAPKATQATDDD